MGTQAVGVHLSDAMHIDLTLDDVDTSVHSQSDNNSSSVEFILEKKTPPCDHGILLDETDESWTRPMRMLTAVETTEELGRRMGMTSAVEIQRDALLTARLAPILRSASQPLRKAVRERTLYVYLACDHDKGPYRTREEATLKRNITEAGIALTRDIASRAEIPHVAVGPPNPLRDDSAVFAEADGVLLADIWHTLSLGCKRQYAARLGEIVDKMRRLKDGVKLGSATYDVYHLVMEKRRNYIVWTILEEPDQDDFADFLIAPIRRSAPKTVRSALDSLIRKDCDLVLTHGDLSPANIVVRGDRIVALLGWDTAGFYPEWWEYVRFFETDPDDKYRDWYGMASFVFQDTYAPELAAFQGISRFR